MRIMQPSSKHLVTVPVKVEMHEKKVEHDPKS